MRNRKFKLLLIAILSASMLSSSLVYAEEETSTEFQSEIESEIVEPETEPPAPETEPPAPETEPPAPETEPPAPETEPPAPETEPPAPETEAQTQPVDSTPQQVSPTPTPTPTPAPKDPVTEQATEGGTEQIAPATEQATVTESKHKKKKKETEESEEETELEEEPEQDPTLHVAGLGETVIIPGFFVDPSKYPPAQTSENVEQIYSYLTGELGLNHAGACGVLGNIQLESNFNPLSLGDSGSSYGICQWHNGRFVALMEHCKSFGLDYNTIEGQLDYLKSELNGGYAGVYDYIRNVPDDAQGAYDAAHYFCVYFESPDNTMARAVQRGNLAKNEYYPLDLFNIGSTSWDPIAEIRASMNGDDYSIDIQNIRKDIDSNKGVDERSSLIGEIRGETSVNQSEEDIIMLDAIRNIRNSN